MLDFLMLFLSQVVSDFSSLNHGLLFQPQLPSISDLLFWIWMLKAIHFPLFFLSFCMKPVCSSPLPLPLCHNEPLQCICQCLRLALLPLHFFFPVLKCQLSTEISKTTSDFHKLYLVHCHKGFSPKNAIWPAPWYIVLNMEGVYTQTISEILNSLFIRIRYYLSKEIPL